MKNLTFKKKLFIIFIMTGLIPLVTISLLAYTTSMQNITYQVQKENELYFQLTKERLEAYFEEKRAEGVSLASTADMYEHLVLLSNQEKNTSAYRQSYQQVDRLLQLIEKEYGFDQIFLTDVNGVVIYSTINKESFEGSDLSHREYFQDAIAGNQNWSSLFATTQGFNAVVLATPVFQDGFSNQTVGTLSFLIQENRITNVVHAGTEYLGETGDAYLINQDGLFYSNTRRGDLQKEAALNEVLDTQAVQLLKGPIENQDYLFSQNVQYPSYLGQEVLGTLGVFQMGDDPMGLVIEVEANEVFAGLYALRNTIVISLLLVSIAGILLAFLFARNMTKPIQETLQVLQRMANGDFSGSLSAESLTRKDETGMMSKAIHQMNDSIKEMIGNVQNAANEVTSSSQQLSSSAKETRLASQEVSTSIVEVAQGSELQVKSSVETETVMEEMAVGIQRVAETATHISESSRVMSEKANSGTGTIHLAVEQMEKIETEAGKTAEIIAVLKTDSDKIGKIIHLITDISEQTNLLALNAAIEAARAGEAGKGFAVVADEIRKLADQTRKSASQIAQLVGNIQHNTTEAANSMLGGKEEVNEGIIVIKEVGQTFDVILTSISSVAGQIEELSAVAEEMSASTEEVTASVSEMATVAKQSASNAEQVAAASEEQLAAIEEVANASNHLRKMAIELQRSVSKFTI